MFKITAVLRDIANYLASISSYQRETCKHLESIAHSLNVSKATITKTKLEIKKWEIKDKEGVVVILEADRFHYLSSEVVWFYIDDEMVASFDDPKSIIQIKGESK